MQARYYVDPATGAASLWRFPPAGFVPLEAWEQERPPREDAGLARVAQIKSRLAELDAQSIRPLRALAEGSATDEDRDRLAAIDQEAEELRLELRGIEADKPDAA